jgi:hypothetical protein
MKVKYPIFLFSIMILIYLSFGCSGGGDSGGSADDSANVESEATVKTNSVPVADAGRIQNVSTGSLVTLDGSGSLDTDGDRLTYNWILVSIPVGSDATLSSTSTLNPSFTADLEGVYQLNLVVNDGSIDSLADSMTVTAAALGFSIPVANAGQNRTVPTGSWVSLDGSGSSDADGDLLSYNWEIVSLPSGSGVSSIAPVKIQNFQVDVDGSYILSLLVNDSTNDSLPDSVIITAITTANAVPVANAGPFQGVSIESQVTLDGSGSSDTDGDPLSYSWIFFSKPAGSSAVLSDASVSRPSFTADVNGSYVLRLTVNDGIFDSIASVTIKTHSFIPDTGQETSYTVTPGEDSDYSLNSPSYTDNSDGTVTDNVTELMWQKVDSGYFHGPKALGTVHPTYNPSGINVCGDLSLSNYSDWRLPTKSELLRIVNYNTVSPPGANGVFEFSEPGTSRNYWSSTASWNYYDTWIVKFNGLDNGTTRYSSTRTSNQYYIRCVRGEQSSSIFSDNGDGTVNDLVTGLMWQQTDSTHDTFFYKNWEEAITHCQGLEGTTGYGYNDWRLPTITELESIRSTNTISLETLYYWSSTTRADVTSDAFYVNFYSSTLQSILYGDKMDNHYAVCVRTAFSNNNYKLPDTGQTTCSDNSGVSIEPCPDPGNALAQDGSYTINPLSYTANSGDNTGTVTDDNTGLMWQQCIEGLTGSDCTTASANTYNWYQATGTAEDTYNLNGASNACGNLSLAGYADWRLPDENELMGIVDYGSFDPAIKGTAFPNTIGYEYWSQTTYASNTAKAWYVEFWNGEVSPGLTATRGIKSDNYYYVRCVRGTSTNVTGFTDNANGTVKDNKTSLVWQKCSLGQNNDGTCSDDTLASDLAQWGNALGYCEGLSLAGTEDWRLPNIKELRSLVDNSKSTLTIDTNAFPNTFGSYYWSSTKYMRPSYEYYAYQVYFGIGDADYSEMSYGNYVRCVRGGQ